MSESITLGAPVRAGRGHLDVPGHEGRGRPDAADLAPRPLSGAPAGPPVPERHEVAERLLLHLVRDVRQGRIAAANLSLEDRRACVEYFTAEGLTVPEIAVTMGVCDRTILRDRRAIRRANALKPSQALGLVKK